MYKSIVIISNLMIAIKCYLRCLMVNIKKTYKPIAPHFTSTKHYIFVNMLKNESIHGLRIEGDGGGVNSDYLLFYCLWSHFVFIFNSLLI